MNKKLFSIFIISVWSCADQSKDSFINTTDQIPASRDLCIDQNHIKCEIFSDSLQYFVDEVQFIESKVSRIIVDTFDTITQNPTTGENISTIINHLSIPSAALNKLTLCNQVIKKDRDSKKTYTQLLISQPLIWKEYSVFYGEIWWSQREKIEYNFFFYENNLFYSECSVLYYLENQK